MEKEERRKFWRKSGRDWKGTEGSGGERLKSGPGRVKNSGGQQDVVVSLRT